MKSQRTLRSDASRIWSAALRAVDPESAVRKAVKLSGHTLKAGSRQFNLLRIKKIWALGAGKAAAPMGKALENILGERLAGGLLVTKYNHGFPLNKIEIVEAGHPLPDAGGVRAAARMISLVQGRIRPDDLVFCLLSGGGSSLLVSPVQGITLEDKIDCTRQLLNAGATIQEINTVRKHLSNLKGGGLARLLAATPTVSLMLSDVVGDDPGTIASGPTTPDTTRFADCMEIIRRLQLSGKIPPAVRRHLELGASGAIGETPKTGDPIFRNSETVIVGSSAQACSAAERTARHLGYNTMILTSRLEGNNEDAARFHMSVAGEIVYKNRPLRRPACIISGGETTVRITGNGKGGRNQEFAMHCAGQLAQLPVSCLVASIGTDGTDGPTDAAGAVADNTTLARSNEHSPALFRECLNNNDSYRFFSVLDDLVMTGPTRTNVMDLHMVLIG